MSEGNMPRPLPSRAARHAASVLAPTPPPRAAHPAPPSRARQLVTGAAPARRLLPTSDQLPYTPRTSRRPSVPSPQPSGVAASSTSSSLASKARAALSSAASLAASTASSVASAAAATTSSEKRGAWEEWARDWRDGRKSSINGKDVINVLPGWAVKRPRKDEGQGADAFDLHVSTTGFCTFVRDPTSISRTQRALMGIAKRFAALPALPNASQVANVMKETITETPEEEKDFDLPMASSPPRHYTARPNPNRQGSSASTASSTRGTTELAFSDPDQLTLAHEYLDLRLRPFWSSVLPYRRVALSMYTVPLTRGEAPPTPTAETFKQEPLMRTTFTTNAQGHWQHHFAIPWERICTHPASVGMAFADDPANDRTDWGLVIRAELLAEEGPDSLRQATGSEDAFEETPDGITPRRIVGSNSFFSSNEIPNRNDGDGQTEMGLMGLGRTSVESCTTVGVSRPGGFRIISDLDDTVKHSDILSGPREVFRNVFCRRLEDICVPGMNELYVNLHDNGLSGLHFVSNSPFELFPMVADFFRLHRFPHYYSLKLKFYGGRSIVTSLFEPAGERKRPSIIEILDEFYDSRFILVGDSGEQDLELYSAIARERPKQIAAVFIRDVTSGRLDELRALSAGFTANADMYKPSARSTPSTSGANTPTRKHSSSSDEDMKTTVQELQELSDDEEKLLKRAAQWDTRVARAYDQVPPQIPLLFFREPEEIESLSLGLLRESDASEKVQAKAK